MKLFFASTFLLVATGLFADEPKKVGTFVTEKTATEIAKDFSDDAAAAKKAYDPNPPKGVRAGGTRINLTGEVDNFSKGGFYLKTGNGLKLFVKSNSKQPAGNGPFKADVSGGSFTRFDGKTITIEEGTATTFK